MSDHSFDFNYSKNHQVRFKKTLSFLEGIINEQDKILDLGPPNPFSKLLRSKGYQVENTPEKLDLDLDYEQVLDNSYDVVTAFELIEHLVSPFPLLQNIKSPKLIASVPLKMWFAKAYWNENDPFDRHYHEFESRQFDMLLNKAGWKIKKAEKWISRSKKIGIRPILRRFTPRYYIVYCQR